jgi:PKD repeat protein
VELKRYKAARVLALGVLLAALPACEELPAAPDIPSEPPITTFLFNPVAPIYAGQTSVGFNASGTRDEDGQVVSYTWTFGDGTPDETTSTPTVRHTFTDTPARCLQVTYGVMLVATDEHGSRGVASQNVTVTELPAPTAQECGGR